MDALGLPSSEEMRAFLLSHTVTKTISAPFDRVKYLLQCRGELVRLGRTDREFKSAYECARRLHSVEGPLSFFRGNFVNIVGILPSAMSQACVGLPVQRLVVDITLSRGDNMSVGASVFASIMGGVTGALASALISYPFDVARFRMGCDVKHFDTAPYLYKSSIDFFTHSNIAESPQLVYRGMGLFVAGSTFYRMAYLAIFDLATRVMPQANADDGDVPMSTVLMQTAGGYGVVAASTLLLHPLDTVRRRYMLSVNHYELQYTSVAHCCGSILKSEGVSAFFRGAPFMLMRGVVATASAMVFGAQL